MEEKIISDDKIISEISIIFFIYDAVYHKLNVASSLEMKEKIIDEFFQDRITKFIHNLEINLENSANEEQQLILQFFIFIQRFNSNKIDDLVVLYLKKIFSSACFSSKQDLFYHTELKINIKHQLIKWIFDEAWDHEYQKYNAKYIDLICRIFYEDQALIGNFVKKIIQFLSNPEVWFPSLKFKSDEKKLKIYDINSVEHEYTDSSEYKLILNDFIRWLYCQGNKDIHNLIRISLMSFPKIMQNKNEILKWIDKKFDSINYNFVASVSLRLSDFHLFICDKNRLVHPVLYNANHNRIEDSKYIDLDSFYMGHKMFQDISEYEIILE